MHHRQLLHRTTAIAAAGLLLASCAADEVLDEVGPDDQSSTETEVALTPAGPDCDELLEDQTLGSSAAELDAALDDHPQLTLVSELLEEVALDPGPDAFERPTFLAPTDAAIEEQLPAQERAELVSDEAALRDVLGLHLLPETWTLDDLAEQDAVGTTQGQDLQVSAETGTVSFTSLDQAIVRCGDIELADAVVHVIDRVLLPDTAAQTGGADDDA